MSDLKQVQVLRTVRVEDGGNVLGREILAGTTDAIPSGLFEGLRAEGYVAEPRAQVTSPPPAKSSGRAAGG